MVKSTCSTWIWLSGRTEPVLTETRCVQLLDDDTQPFMHFMYPNYDGMFRDDNAPSRRACVVSDWLWTIPARDLAHELLEARLDLSA